MTRGRPLIALGCIAAALYAGGLFYEIDFAPEGCCGLTWPTPDPASAERLAATRDPKGLDAAVQRTAAVAVLGANPTEPVGWVRLAYADWLSHGGMMTQTANRALEESYRMAPYNPAAPLRITFALANWSQLTPDARKRVLKEIELARSDAPRGEEARWKELQRAVRQTQLDPSGHMTAVLLGLI